LLFAGTTSLFSFKYSILNDIVKILKLWSKSAGNNILSYKNNVGTSETIRNEIIQTEEIKLISKHIPTHQRPVNDNQLGHYLAGLIDGDGHFSSKQQLVIVFNSLDSSLAYYLKKEIGYGTVHKVKNKNAVILVVANKKGMERVINLVNGKLRTNKKLYQIEKNILSNYKYKDFSKITTLSLNTDKNLNNLWLAGFSDADASFQIKLITRNNHTEVRLNFQIDQKENNLLILIKELLGGNIGYRKSQDTYYYGSTSFGSAKKVINYFDHYHLLSSKHINFLKWRKAYIIIQNKDHLTETGLDKIKKLKSTMNSLSVSKLDLI